MKMVLGVLEACFSMFQCSTEVVVMIARTLCATHRNISIRCPTRKTCNFFEESAA